MPPLAADDFPPVVVIDTNVLYGMPLADTLLTAAEQRLFHLRWTIEILEELRETMLARQLPARSVERRLAAIRTTFADGEERGYEALMPTFQLPDPDDRHVLAAAMHAGATTIVTQNAKDFPPDVLAPSGIVAVGPETFLLDLTAHAPRRMLDVVRQQASRLRQPSITFERLIDKLAPRAPRFSATLRVLDALDRGYPDHDLPGSAVATPDRLPRDYREIGRLIEAYRLLEQRQRVPVGHLGEAAVVSAAACALVRQQPGAGLPVLHHAVYLARLDISDQLPGGWGELQREMDRARKET